MKPLVILSQANEDLVKQAQSIADLSFEAALRFYGAVELATAMIQSRPDAGTGFSCSVGPMRVYSIPTFRKYLIFFRETNERIEIVRLLHGGMDWMREFSVSD